VGFWEDEVSVVGGVNQSFEKSALCEVVGGWGAAKFFATVSVLHYEAVFGGVIAVFGGHGVPVG